MSSVSIEPFLLITTRLFPSPRGSIRTRNQSRVFIAPLLKHQFTFIHIIWGEMVMCCPLFDAMQETGDRILLAPHLVLCLDFDGTLAQFADDPAQVQLTPQMQRVLWLLAKREEASLVIISSRDRADLQTRVAIPDVIFAGNHGLEISGPGYLFVEPDAASRCPSLQALEENLMRRLQHIPGVVVEDKGLMLSIHYGQAPAGHWPLIQRTVRRALAGLQWSYSMNTREKAFEIRPCGAWNKGSAVALIRDQFGMPGGSMIYVGDDITDEEAFVALPEDITIKVGDPQATAAHFYVDGPLEVRGFLEWVEGLLRDRSARAADREFAMADTLA